MFCFFLLLFCFVFVFLFFKCLFLDCCFFFPSVFDFFETEQFRMDALSDCTTR